MTSVRSAVIVYRRATAAVNETLATCPEGLTLLIKRLLVYNWGTSNAVANIYLINQTFNAFPFLIRDSLTPQVPVDLETWQVLMPGDQLAWQTSTGDIDLWVSGAVLYGAPVGWTPQ